MRCTQKEIREKLGISRDTLRFYEQKGIIEPEIDPQNGYRYYDDWQVNLLWDCKQYQSMGFSLAEVLEILNQDTVDELAERVERRTCEVEAEIRRKELELTNLRTRAAEMRRAKGSLGLFEFVDFPGRYYVPIRENHGFCDAVGAEAVALSNANFSVSHPLLWFPRLGENHFFWGYACTSATYQAIGAPEAAGVVHIDAATALSTWVDAGDRWNVGLPLFAGLVAEAHKRCLTPRGEICADLVARAHDNDGYHRYLHVYLPLV